MGGGGGRGRRRAEGRRADGAEAARRALDPVEEGVPATRTGSSDGGELGTRERRDAGAAGMGDGCFFLQCCRGIPIAKKYCTERICIWVLQESV